MTTLREDFVSCYYSLILVLFIFWLEGVCINALPGQWPIDDKYRRLSIPTNSNVALRGRSS